MEGLGSVRREFESGVPTVSPSPESEAAGGSESALSPIWRWAPNWQCPLLGMALSLGEQRRVFKRPQKTRRMGAYELHQALMTVAGEENKVSRRIDRLLRRRFQRTIAETASLPPDEFLECWRRDWQGNQGLALFYVAAARGDLDEEMRREIYGCVHMAGHVAAVDLLAAREEAARQREANVRLARTVRRMKADARRREEAQRARQRAQRAARVGRTTPAVAPPVSRPKSQMAGEDGAARQRLQAEVRRLEQEKRDLAKRLADLEDQNRVLAAELRDLIARVTAVAECRGACGGEETPPPACPRRVLIVGGLSRLHHLYREIVAAAGGELDYHDGSLRQGGDNLSARIDRSDLVICPVNCNSHNACKRVKGLCKRMNKPLKILPTASLSAISATLKGDAAAARVLN